MERRDKMDLGAEMWFGEVEYLNRSRSLPLIDNGISFEVVILPVHHK